MRQKKIGFRKRGLALLTALSVTLGLATSLFPKKVEASSGTFEKSRTANIAVSYRGTPKWGKNAGQYHDEYSQTNGGNYIPIDSYTINGETSFCIEPTVSTAEAGASFSECTRLDGAEPSKSEKHELELIAYYGYHKRGKTERVRAYTQLLIWEKAGMQIERVAGADAGGFMTQESLTSDYNTFKASVLKDVNEHKSIPSWNKESLTLKVGESRVLSDLSSATSRLQVYKNTANAEVAIDKDKRTVTVTAKADSVDGYIKFAKTEPGFINTTLFYTDPVKQSQVVLYDSDPVKGELNISIQKKAPVTVQKADVVSGALSLAGATYSLVKVDTGAEVARYTTDEQGRFTTEDLDFGEYDLVEVSPTTGYLVNGTAVRFTVGAENAELVVRQTSFNQESLLAELNAHVAEVNNAISANKAKREPLPLFTSKDIQTDASVLTFERKAYGRIELNKHRETTNGDSGEREPEEDVQFSILDGNTVVDTLVTNHKGYATSGLLEVGKAYTLRQDSVPDEDTEKVKDFAFTLTADKQVKHYTLENALKTFYLRIVKQDAQTKEVIPASGIGFELYRADGSKVTQTVTYPKVETISVFYTNEQGEVTLPEKLKTGRYTVKEVVGAKGYFLPEEGLSFDLDARASDANSDLVLTFTVENKAIEGQLELYKKGEVFKGWKEENGLFVPVLEEGYLAGAEFTLTDKHGNVVETLVTREEGAVLSKPLPLGCYTLTETNAPNGYVGKTSQEVCLDAEQSHKAIVVKPVSVKNEFQRFTFSFDKRFERSRWFKHEETAPESTIFQLVTKEDVMFNGHTLKAGSVVGESKLTKTERSQEDTLTPVTRLEERVVANGRFEVLDANGNALRFRKNEDGVYLYQASPSLSLVDVPDVTVEAPVFPEFLEGEPEEAFQERVRAYEEAKALYEAQLKAKAEAEAENAERQGNYESANANYLANGTELVSDKDGQLFLSNLPEGQYRLKSKTLPEGFAPIEKEISEEVVREARGKYVHLTLKEQFEVKGDATETENEKDATVPLYTASFSNLLPAKYLLREKTTGEAYQVHEDVDVELAYDENGEKDMTKVLETPLVNKLQEKELVITKLSRQSKLPIEGVTFKLVAVTKDKEYEVGRYKTDVNGKIRISNLELGDYYLEEIETPSGFIQDKTKHKVSFDKETQKQEVTIYNDEIPNIPNKPRFPQSGETASTLPALGTMLTAMGVVVARRIQRRKREEIAFRTNQRERV